MRIALIVTIVGLVFYNYAMELGQYDRIIVGKPWVALWRRTPVWAQYHAHKKFCALFWRGNEPYVKGAYFGTVTCKELTPPFPVGR